MYDSANFYKHKSQGSFWEEITGLRLWYMMGKFLREEENKVVIFYRYTTSILYYIPSHRKKSSV